MLDIIDQILGLSAQTRDITILQMSARAVVVFFFAIAIIRIGDERFMGRHTALDVLLGIVFGSVVSRAISGTAPFFPTLAACMVLVALHWIISALSQYSGKFAFIFTGRSRPLIIDGELDRKQMHLTHISEADLREAVRAHGKNVDLSLVKRATLERNGSISIVFASETEIEAKPSNKPPDE